MINLEDQIGLNIQLKENFRLEFSEDVEFDEFSVRKFSDLQKVAADENLNLSEESAYLMYRNVRKKDDLSIINSAHLRFDLTIIPPANIGDEYIKTSGHYHPKKAGTEVAYPELYYVVSGQATYLNQKPKGARIEDVILSRVKAGQAIITPPNYGHVTINELDQPIVMANWVCDDFKSVYGDYEEKRGGCYYLANNASAFQARPRPEGGKLIMNDRYGGVPEVKEMKSEPKILAEMAGIPVYNYIQNIEKLAFLSSPEEYTNDLAVENLFRG